jgi:hypothetical protein
MPNSYLEKIAKKKDIPMDVLENRWKKAKLLAAKEGFKDKYDYIMGIFKRMVNEEGEPTMSIATGGTSHHDATDGGKNKKCLKRNGKCDTIEESKSDYEVYHDTMADAFTEVRKQLKKNGYKFDEEDYYHKVSIGPRKPSKGKTNTYKVEIVDTKNGKKKLAQIQIYNTGKKFELNFYGLSNAYLKESILNEYDGTKYKSKKRQFTKQFLKDSDGYDVSMTFKYVDKNGKQQIERYVNMENVLEWISYMKSMSNVYIEICKNRVSCKQVDYEKLKKMNIPDMQKYLINTLKK